MNIHPHFLRRIGARIRFAREAAGLTQQELSDALGFADRQTLSAIEKGERRVQPEELVRAGTVLDRAVDWFIDPFVVAGEAKFSWRVAEAVSDDVLGEFESQVGQIVGMMRHLKHALNGPSKALRQTLQIPAYSDYQEAWGWGEAVAQELSLGLVPAKDLVDAIERRLDISVLFIDVELSSTHKEVSGAMCRLPDLGVILINRQESAVRRNFDVAHELFHALTWDVLPPEWREGDGRDTSNKTRRIEQLADNFAAGLLMPKTTLDKLIPQDRLGDTLHLAQVAHQLQVSTGALAYRLYNAKMIDLPTRRVLLEARGPRLHTERPSPFSSAFAILLHDGLANGHVSARKAAKALSMTLHELAAIMTEHGKPVPFEL